MEENIKSKILAFLYDQVQQNKIPQIKKGMVEDLEIFIMDLLAEQEAHIAASRMIQHPNKVIQEDSNEADS